MILTNKKFLGPNFEYKYFFGPSLKKVKYCEGIGSTSRCIPSDTLTCLLYSYDSCDESNQWQASLQTSLWNPLRDCTTHRLPILSLYVHIMITTRACLIRVPMAYPLLYATREPHPYPTHHCIKVLIKTSPDTAQFLLTDGLDQDRGNVYITQDLHLRIVPLESDTDLGLIWQDSTWRRA